MSARLVNLCPHDGFVYGTLNTKWDSMDMGPKRYLWRNCCRDKKNGYEVIGNIPYGKKLWLYVQ